MINLDCTYYRVVSTMPADGWQSCWEERGEVRRGDLAMWAVVEAVYRYDQGTHRRVSLVGDFDRMDSRVVGMDIADGIVACAEDASNFLGYCRRSDVTTGYESEAEGRRASRVAAKAGGNT